MERVETYTSANDERLSEFDKIRDAFTSYLYSDGGPEDLVFIHDLEDAIREAEEIMSTLRQDLHRYQKWWNEDRKKLAAYEVLYGKPVN